MLDLPDMARQERFRRKQPRFERPTVHLTDPLTWPGGLAPPVFAVGNFDGVHRGHQALIATATTLASSAGALPFVLTFDPHPRVFFRRSPEPFELTPPGLKVEAAIGAGAHGVVTLTFDAALAGLTARAFVDEILCGRLGCRGIVVGEDFHFGRGREGSADTLAMMGRELGIAVAIVPPVMVDGEPASSSRVRQALSAGDMAGATRLLGRPWKVRAVVAHGDKRGRLLGYPTANLILAKDVALKYGIYAVRATVRGVTHEAVASFGSRPTFDNGAPRLEVHLFDFSGDLYGQTMDVDFIGFIRPELKFDGVEPLIRQMDEDSRAARDMLNGVSTPPA
jgi:riboflavin kinase/FMN adenylyltransferase